GARLPGPAPAADPRPVVARLRPQPGRRPGPRPGPDHHPPRAHRVVPPGGLRTPVRRGVLADEQGDRGPLRPVPCPRRRSGAAARGPVTGAGDPAHTGEGGDAADGPNVLLGALSLDIYLGRDLVLPGGGVLNIRLLLARS